MFLQAYELISSLGLHELLQLRLAEQCGQAGLAIDTKHDGEDIKFNILALSQLKQHLHSRQPIQETWYFTSVGGKLQYDW